MCPKVLRNLASLVFFPQKGKVSFNDDGSRNYSIINVAQMISCKHVTGIIIFAFIVVVL